MNKPLKAELAAWRIRKNNYLYQMIVGGGEVNPFPAMLLPAVFRRAYSSWLLEWHGREKPEVQHTGYGGQLGRREEPRALKTWGRETLLAWHIWGSPESQAGTRDLASFICAFKFYSSSPCQDSHARAALQE